MTTDDRRRWDARHRQAGDPSGGGPPPGLAAAAELLPRSGAALELACGRGRTAVWLAARGLVVQAVDVSPVAVDLARGLVARAGLTDRCTVDVWDLDDGLPPGPAVDLVLCHRYHDPRLHGALVDRLVPGGVLAVAVLSEVGHGPGRFRAPAGALSRAFGHLELLAEGEGRGEAWVVARRPAGTVAGGR